METIATAGTRVQPRVNPSRIIQTGMGFWASKILLTAVKIGLFTRLGRGPANAEKLKVKLGLHERGLYDFLDALVALGFLERKGLKENAIYSNTEETDLYLDQNKPTYIGSILEMANNRLYPLWNDLETALRTGKPQNESKDGNKRFFEALYEDDTRLREFVRAMGSIQMENFFKFSKEFDFSGYEVHCDIGGGGGYLASQIATHQPHMKCISFDLPKVSTIALENHSRMDFTPRVEIRSGDFFKDPFPEADLITMGNILHDWGLEDKKKLISKAYKALSDGGALVAIENIIDKDRRLNSFGLMMSLDMLLETEAGFDYSAEEFENWTREAGFSKTAMMPLIGPASAVIAYK